MEVAWASKWYTGKSKSCYINLRLASSIFSVFNSYIFIYLRKKKKGRSGKQPDLFCLVSEMFSLCINGA
jgi:hypothetical protein